MNFRIATFLFFISLTIQAQHTRNSAPIEIDDLAQLYVTNNFTIEYPVTWELDTSGLLGSEFFIFSMLSSPKDKFRENINLKTEDLSGQNITLNQYVDNGQQLIFSLLTKPRLVESKRMLNRGLEFQKIIYQATMGKFKLTFEQYIWIIDENAFVLTLTCGKKQFKDYQEVGENILNSFTFRNIGE